MNTLKIGRIFVLLAFVVMFVFSSCQESLEDKAERQAKDYTRKYCPTPVSNYTRTDSIVFDRNKKVYVYYISFFDELDDQKIIDLNRDRLAGMLNESIKDSPSLKGFLEAGFRFEYVCHSGRNPMKVLVKIQL